MRVNSDVRVQKSITGSADHCALALLTKSDFGREVPKHRPKLFLEAMKEEENESKFQSAYVLGLQARVLTRNS